MGYSVGKESACNAGDTGLIPGWGRSPGGRHGNPLQYSCLENPHGQRNLAGYSPWGHKEWNTTERLSTAQYSLAIYGKKTELREGKPLSQGHTAAYGRTGLSDS